MIILNPTSPITLTTAFAGAVGRIIPGDILLLRGGTYTSNYINTLIGTSGAYITLMPYQNERVIIDGSFSDIPANYITYIDLEFTSELGTRLVDSVPPNPLSVDFHALGVKVINCLIHDTYNLGAWDNVDLFYGTATWNNGYRLNNNTGFGHSLYMQNQDGGHLKVVKHSLFGRSANFGLHGYATDFNLTNITIIENVLLPNANVPDSRHLIGSLNTDNNIRYTNNHSYGLVQLGYGGDNNTNLTMTGNRMYAPDVGGNRPFNLNFYKSGDIENNIITMGTSGGNNRDVVVYGVPSSPGAMTWDNNSYYNRSGKTDCFDDNITHKTIAQWRAAYGFDIHSTMTLDGSSPVDSIHVYPNDYAFISRRKGMFVIWNWSQLATVNVDLSSLGIAQGTSCKLLQSQDPLVDQRVFTMPSNGIISVSMIGTVASVTGWADPPTTFPIFGAFMVETV